jgi:hypothetical protein
MVYPAWAKNEVLSPKLPERKGAWLKWYTACVSKREALGSNPVTHPHPQQRLWILSECFKTMCAISIVCMYMCISQHSPGHLNLIC